MIMRRRTFLISSFALAGCSGLDTRSTSIGPVSLKDLRYIPFAPKSPVGVTVDERSSQTRFAANSVNCTGLHFGKADTTRYIEFSTYRTGFLVPIATVFVPSFMFLNESFEQIKTVEPPIYQDVHRIHPPSPLAQQSFYGVASVPREAAYVVIFTEPSKQKTETVALVQGGGLGGDLAVRDYALSLRRFTLEEFSQGKPQEMHSRWHTHKISRAEFGEISALLSVI